MGNPSSTGRINAGQFEYDFINPPEKGGGWGKIIYSTEAKPNNISKQLTEALNSPEIDGLGNKGRISEQEAMDYYSSNAQTFGLDNLLILQGVERDVGLSLFTPAATGFINDTYGHKLAQLFPNKGLSNIKKGSQGITFEYKGTKFTLDNGGVRFITSVNNVSSGPKSYALHFTLADFMEDASGHALIMEPDVRKIFIPLLDQALKTAEAIDKAYQHERAYNFDFQPGPIQVWSKTKHTVQVYAFRNEIVDDPIPTTAYDEEDGELVPSPAKDLILTLNIDNGSPFVTEEADLRKMNKQLGENGDEDIEEEGTE